MTTLTYERLKTLHQAGPSRQNLLKDLHDYIYQWTETIPTGGIRIDISQALKTIYEQHAKHLAAEKARTTQSKKVQSIDSLLAESDYNEDDTEWDY
jgi:hypothetical protein